MALVDSLKAKLVGSICIGIAGKSAYEYAREGGYTGTEEEFAEKMARELGSHRLTVESNLDLLLENGRYYMVGGGNSPTILSLLSNAGIEKPEEMSQMHAIALFVDVTRQERSSTGAEDYVGQPSQHVTVYYVLDKTTDYYVYEYDRVHKHSGSVSEGDAWDRWFTATKLPFRDEPETFTAEYGVTTYAEISAAYQAGKICKCRSENGLTELYLVSCGGPRGAVFSGADAIGTSNYLYQYAVSRGNVWSQMTNYPANKDDIPEVVEEVTEESTDEQIPTAKAVYNAVKNAGGGGGSGEPGADGGYYTPSIAQVDDSTMKVSFAASKAGMAAVEDQRITLPAGPDGKTPYIGENGNWWIGEEDTGVCAGQQEMVYVTVTSGQAGSYIGDKTFKEVYDALVAGKLVYTMYKNAPFLCGGFTAPSQKTYFYPINRSLGYYLTYQDRVFTETELENGVTPDIQIGEVVTLPAGSEATASISGTAENPLLNLGIPRGADGEGGGENSGISGYERLIDFTTEEDVTEFSTPTVDSQIAEKIKTAREVILEVHVPRDSADTETSTLGTVTVSVRGSWLWTLISADIIPAPTETWTKHGQLYVRSIFTESLNEASIQFNASRIRGRSNSTKYAINPFFNDADYRNMEPNVSYFKVAGSQSMAAGTRLVVGVRK